MSQKLTRHEFDYIMILWMNSGRRFPFGIIPVTPDDGWTMESWADYDWNPPGHFSDNPKLFEFVEADESASDKPTWFELLEINDPSGKETGSQMIIRAFNEEKKKRIAESKTPEESQRVEKAFNELKRWVRSPANAKRDWSKIDPTDDSYW